MPNRLLFLVCVIVICSTFCRAQVCNNRFSSVIFKGISFDSFRCATVTPANEIVTAGSLYNYHGFVAKFSAKGNPLYSYQYNPIFQGGTTYFSNTTWTAIANTSDGGVIVAGTAQQLFRLYATDYFNKIGVLLKLDRFGGVQWCKNFVWENALSAGGSDLGMTAVYQSPSGDIMAYLASDYGRGAVNHGWVICLSATGVQKWKTFLPNTYDGGTNSLHNRRAIHQTADGTLVVAEVAYKTVRTGTTPTINEAALHLLGLSATDGKLKWETWYNYPLAKDEARADVAHLSSTANNQLVVSTSFVQPLGIKQGLRVITNNTGAFVSAKTYGSTGGEAVQLLSTTNEPTGNQVWLMKKAKADILTKLSTDGSIIWQWGLQNSSGTYPANILASTPTYHGVFGSNFQNREVRLLLTDTAGDIDCLETPSDLTATDITLQAVTGIFTNPSQSERIKYAVGDFPMRADAYPLERRVDCEAQPDCCTDKTDSTSQPAVTICEGSRYLLPDNTPVTKAGTYFASYTSPLGCDSIVFYRVRVDKHPRALSLGPDLCIEDRDSLTLSATGGYDRYSWMNMPAVADSTYRIGRTGRWRVSVQNACGEGADTVEVFDRCNFPVYMPSAFTPNKDGKNDIFRVPPANNNRFVSLRIFNRWGQVVFYTREAGKGWNGAVNGLPQETGVYVYFLEMKGLSGTSITHHGSIVLIR